MTDERDLSWYPDEANYVYAEREYDPITVSNKVVDWCPGDEREEKSLQKTYGQNDETRSVCNSGENQTGSKFTCDRCCSRSVKERLRRERTVAVVVVVVEHSEKNHRQKAL
jgi:hypothetical protein